ncbi:hypothetical protein [Massilia sp. BJB1822]|uniref:hypothetical protein n=1 Tax=Massilia sp. BJB1822 TaxID=2744470 RepID=UPI0015939AE8|nr:hypothetical protein [Massilia sp. BJB1822]NVE01518.1 hypothetical protein [Massilia sp. BJB1822]
MSHVRPLLYAAALLLLNACGSGPRVPDWQMNAQSSMERATAAYMSGNASVEKNEFKRAREQLASTGKMELVIRAELIRCAARVAALTFEDCSGFEALRADASAADIAYANYLAGRANPADAALLPEPQRAILAASSDTAATAAAQAISDPLSRLVAAGALFRANRATPELLTLAIDTASAQGWRRPLLAWLNVQAQRAEKAGDTAETARLRRRIALVQSPTP